MWLHAIESPELKNQMKTIGEFIAKVGVPSALAVYLVYVLSSSQVQSQGQKLDALIEIQSITNQRLTHHIESTAPLVSMQQQILNVSLAQCVNSARAQRQPVDTCFSALYQQPVRPQSDR
jgi:hypothetical protein